MLRLRRGTVQMSGCCEKSKRCSHLWAQWKQQLSQVWHLVGKFGTAAWAIGTPAKRTVWVLGLWRVSLWQVESAVVRPRHVRHVRVRHRHFFTRRRVELQEGNRVQIYTAAEKNKQSGRERTARFIIQQYLRTRLEERIKGRRWSCLILTIKNSWTSVYCSQSCLSTSYNKLHTLFPDTLEHDCLFYWFLCYYIKLYIQYIILHSSTLQLLPVYCI